MSKKDIPGGLPGPTVRVPVEFELQLVTSRCEDLERQLAVLDALLQRQTERASRLKDDRDALRAKLEQAREALQDALSRMRPDESGLQRFALASLAALDARELKPVDSTRPIWVFDEATGTMKIDAGKEAGMRHAVRWFADQMEQTMRHHDDSRGSLGWRGETLSYLGERLREEVEELKEACNHTLGPDYPESVQRVIRESVDVANFAMMIADVTRMRAEREAGG